MRMRENADQNNSEYDTFHVVIFSKSIVRLASPALYHEMLIGIIKPNGETIFFKKMCKSFGMNFIDNYRFINHKRHLNDSKHHLHFKSSSLLQDVLTESFANLLPC